MQEFLRTRLVNKDEWEIGHKKFGSVYFIRDENADCIKIGHSHNPWTRLRILQTGSANRLILIGIMLIRLPHTNAETY
jgi:hypothetical protein